MHAHVCVSNGGERLQHACKIGSSAALETIQVNLVFSELSVSGARWVQNQRTGVTDIGQMAEELAVLDNLDD